MPTLTWIGKEKVVNHHLDVPYRVLIETKGDYLANEESRAKLSLGRIWQAQAGRKYRYFMVFQEEQLQQTAWDVPASHGLSGC